MRALILADEFFASRERALLTRLEVGLADEGVRVIHAIPLRSKADSPGGVFSKVLTYAPKTFALTRPLAVRRLIGAIADLDGQEEAGQIDVVHVFGGSAWTLGAELAAELGAGLVLEVWRAGLVERALAVRAREDDPPLLIAPDEAIERALRDAAAAAGLEPTVRLAPWGVLTTGAGRTALQPDRAITAMVVGSGRDAAAFAAAFEGLARVVRRFPDMQVFCDAVAARRAGVWALARRLDLLRNVSLIQELEGRRDLLLHGDLLIQPDAHGEQRSIVLEAMAGGMVVVAARDAAVSILKDGQTARLVPSGDAEAWHRVLADVVDDPERSRRLAAAAHDFVKAHRRASDYVRAVLASYAWLTSEESIPFPGPTP